MQCSRTQGIMFLGLHVTLFPSHCAEKEAVDNGEDPVVSDIVHEALFEQLCCKIMLPSFDPDTQALPSWLTDRTLLQL